MECPSCAAPLPAGARFCPSCGAPQVAVVGERHDDERRVVTVLFADLVGYTTLAEGRDPERVKRLIDTVFEQLVADVEAHGGVVDKVLGDAILALFGAPVAHEDDADRAVRAALAMQATLRAFRDEHPADAVRMRIGINTGEVLVGTLAGTDYTAMGDVVNTASRLQELAPPGAVYVGATTRELCSPAIRFRAVDPVRLRGRAAATHVWQAVGFDRALATRRWQADVPFVGRDAELGVLAAACSIVAAGRAALVAVSGEAGIGKTRLVHEAIDRLLAERPDTLLLEGACAPYGESNVWWPVAGGLLAEVGLDRNLAPEEARRRITRRLTAWGELDPDGPEFARVVELVLHLLGHPSALDAHDPAALRDAVFGGIVSVLRRQAERRIVVVRVDDLHWAAPLLVDLLESTARQLAGLPVLIVTTHRPTAEVLEDWPPSVEPAVTLHLSLEPLGSAEAATLATRAASPGVDAVLPAGVVDQIVVRSGGNPLFLVELARMAASGVTGTDAGVEGVGELPNSLRALIAARLDQLTTSQRAVVDNAAIIGNTGRIGALREFANELGQRYDPDDLHALTAAGLLVRMGSRWSFRSHVVREVAYQTLTKQARAQRHAGVARFLAGREPAAIELRAHHATSAAELVAEVGTVPGVPDDIAVVAAELLAESAARWNRQGAHRRGRELADRGLDLDGVPDGARCRLVSALSEALVGARELRLARAAIAELAELAAVTGDRVADGEAHRLLGRVEQLEGDLVAARRELGRAVAVFRELGDDEHLGEALRARGFAEIFGGSLADAAWFLGEADALFERTGNDRGAAWVLQHRAWVAFLAGDQGVAERNLGLAIEAFERLGDRSGKAWSCGLLAYVYHVSGRDDGALELADQALAEARQWGDVWGEAMMYSLQASVHLWRGDLDEARALAERSHAAFRRIDDRFGMVQALGTLTRAFVALGRFADADRSTEEVLVLAGSFGELAYPTIAAAGAAMHLGQGERASALASEAIGRLDTTGASIDEALAVLAFGCLLAGETDAALAHLLDCDVERSSLALAARSTARALVGDRDGALADVRRVEAMPQVSYWDRLVAEVAGVVAAAGDEAVHRRAELAVRVAATRDVVLAAYASEVLARLALSESGASSGGAGPGPDEPPLEGAPHHAAPHHVRVPLAGWADVARALTAA